MQTERIYLTRPRERSTGAKAVSLWRILGMAPQVIGYQQVGKVKRLNLNIMMV